MLQQPRVPPTGQRQAVEVHIKWREVLDYKRELLRCLSLVTGWGVDKLDADMQRPLYMRPQVCMVKFFWGLGGGGQQKGRGPPGGEHHRPGWFNSKPRGSGGAAHRPYRAVQVAALREEVVHLAECSGEHTTLCSCCSRWW